VKLYVPLMISFFAGFLCFACTGMQEKESASSEKTLISGKELPELTEARNMIEFGSPESILSAMDTLQGSPAGNSRSGRELMYIAENLLSLVYPELGYSTSVSMELGGSIFPKLFRDVRSGRFSPLIEEWDSFLELTVAACAALISSDKDVLILCVAAAGAAADMEEQSVLPPYLLGVVELKQGDYVSALSMFQSVLSMDESCYPAKWQAARIHRRFDDHRRALPLLSSLVERFPGVESYTFELAGCYIDLDEPESAVETLEALDIGEQSEDFNDYLFLRAAAAAAKGEYRQAAEYLEILYNRMPEELGVLERYGTALLKAGQTEAAVPLLEEAVEKGSKNLEILRPLFLYRYNRGDLISARAVADNYFDLFTGPGTLLPMLKMYLELRDYGQALRVAEKLYPQAEEDPEFLSLYARALVEEERYGRSGEIIRRALEMTDSAQLRSRLFYLQSRMTEDRKRRLQFLQEALFENMQNLAALIAISDEYAQIGEYRKAHRYMKQAAALDPENEAVAKRLEELEVIIGQ
jgi:tetratricopeptide (TPR) repeat protein